MRSVWAIQKPGGGLLCEMDGVPSLFATKGEAQLDCWERDWTPVKVRIIEDGER